MKHARCMILAAMIGLTLAQAAWAGSIWRAGHKRSASLYVDDKAAGVGDIVTIVVNEASKVDNTSDRDLTKSDTRSMKITNGEQLDVLRGIDALTGKLMNLPKLDFSAAANTGFSGKTSFGSERKIEDEITVVVEDVLPNGNMVVVGKQIRKINGETQTTQVSGIIRPSDIGYDNRISSRRVANFHIVTEHQGQENRFTEPGWLAKVLNFINPF